MKLEPQLVRVISTGRQSYGGRWYYTGDVIEMPEADARDLFAMGLAKPAPPDKKNSYKRRDMRAE